MKTIYETLLVEVKEQVALVTLNAPKSTNPFSRKMTRELTLVCQDIQEELLKDEPEVKAIVLTGGKSRSFSTGGDFYDITQIQTAEEIRIYISEILDLYIALLKVNIPVIAAIDGYAIGQGFQVALLADWRIGTSSCQLQMPELKHGIACPVGSMILEMLFGRGLMLSYIINCDSIDIEHCLVHGILNEISQDDAFIETALSKADVFKKYPYLSFSTTKKINNARFIKALESVYEDSLNAHVVAFLNKTGTAHFSKILRG